MKTWAETIFPFFFTLQGLENENSFKTESDVEIEMDGETIVTNITGNYIVGLHNIDLISGVISHGGVNQAKQLLENWRDYVFGEYVVSIEEKMSNVIEKSVFPNPSNGLITIQITDKAKVHTL